MLLLSLIACSVVPINTFASDADVGKKENSEIVEGSLIDFDCSVFEYNVIETVNFEIQINEVVTFCYAVEVENPFIAPEGDVAKVAPMFVSPQSRKYCPVSYRRARDGLSCASK